MGDRATAVQYYLRAQAAAGDASGTANHQLAYQVASSAVTIDPTLSAGWSLLGIANSKMHFGPAALACWRRAQELPLGAEGSGDLTPRSRFENLWNIGDALSRMGRYDEAREALVAAIAIEPREAMPWTLLSVIDRAEGLNGQAVSHAHRAHALAPDNATCELALAFALLFNGDLADGLRHYESRFRARLPHYLQFPMPQWDGAPGRTLFLVSDQGIGDTVSFSRFATAAVARCAKVYMHVHAELERLFRDAFCHCPNVEIIPNQINPTFPAVDCWSTFMSLPHALGLTTEEIRDAPPISVPDYTLPTTWRSPDRDLHVGVAWKGATNSDIDHWRSFPIHHLLELYRVPGIQLYGLQVGEGVADIYNTGSAALIRDLSPRIRDCADTLALLKGLDLVITVESALAHLCGLIGKECWVPYSRYGKDWRAGFRGEKPLWYGAHRFFCQGDDATWEPVFERITHVLQKRIDRNKMKDAAE